jgi:hypothetical protein
VPSFLALAKDDDERSKSRLSVEFLLLKRCAGFRLRDILAALRWVHASIPSFLPAKKHPLHLICRFAYEGGERVGTADPSNILVKFRLYDHAENRLKVIRSKCHYMVVHSKNPKWTSLANSRACPFWIS